MECTRSTPMLVVVAIAAFVMKLLSFDRKTISIVEKHIRTAELNGTGMITEMLPENMKRKRKNNCMVAKFACALHTHTHDKGRESRKGKMQKTFALIQKQK